MTPICNRKISVILLPLPLCCLQISEIQDLHQDDSSTTSLSSVYKKCDVMRQKSPSHSKSTFQWLSEMSPKDLDSQMAPRYLLPSVPAWIWSLGRGYWWLGPRKMIRWSQIGHWLWDEYFYLDHPRRSPILILMLWYFIKYFIVQIFFMFLLHTK